MPIVEQEISQEAQLVEAMEKELRELTQKGSRLSSGARWQSGVEYRSWHNYEEGIDVKKIEEILQKNYPEAAPFIKVDKINTRQTLVPNFPIDEGEFYQHFRVEVKGAAHIQGALQNLMNHPDKNWATAISSGNTGRSL